METLFEYLQSSPLPILVVNLHDPFSKPILLNDSFKVLTKGMGEDLLSVIHQESEGELRKWLSGGKEETMGGSTENYSSEEGKIQVAEFHALDSTELQMELKTSPNAFEKLPLVNWRRKTIPDGSNSFIILTGLLVVPPPRVPLPAYHSSHSSASSSTSSLLSYSEGGRINTRRPSIPSVARQARPIEERLRELELLTEFSMVGLARLDLQGRIIWGESLMVI